MALRDYLEREVRLSMACSNCGNIQYVIDETKGTALGIFRKRGWIETEEHILCPVCVSRGVQ